MKLIFLTILTILFKLMNHINASRPQPIKALYAFGDSTVDSGNNNYIPTLFKSNHSPYGKSFPTDFLASSLRLKPSIPAYLNPSVKPVDLLNGVSFASAGGGLDDRTAMLSLALTMDKQWSYFEEAVHKMKSLVGDSKTRQVIRNALFVISAGTNDMTYNVYDQARGSVVSVSKYQDYLLSKVEACVQRLYRAGARRITITGLPPIGCLPVHVTLASLSTPLHHETCTEYKNSDSRIYNQKLKMLKSRLNRRLRGSKINYLDIYSPIIDMITHPPKYGLLEILKGCCGTGLLEAGPYATYRVKCLKMFQSVCSLIQYTFRGKPILSLLS